MQVGKLLKKSKKRWEGKREVKNMILLWHVVLTPSYLVLWFPVYDWLKSMAWTSQWGTINNTQQIVSISLYNSKKTTQ